MTNKRVIFVGMHNKPNMQPLDSRTMTGKVIDKIIEQIPTECIKTNLCDIDYFPKDFLLINQSGIDWRKRHEPTKADVIVTLGVWVKENFWYDDLNVIHLTHPAGIFGAKNKIDYVNRAVEKIKNELQNCT